MFLRVLCLSLLAASALFAADAATPSTSGAAATPAKPKTFLYVLRLVPRLHDDKAWTEADNAIIGKHFNHLKAAAERGQVVHGGRTLVSGDKTFGLIIFEAADETAARAFMDSDPAIEGKIMTAELFPYAAVFRRKN